MRRRLFILLTLLFVFAFAITACEAETTEDVVVPGDEEVGIFEEEAVDEELADIPEDELDATPAVDYDVVEEADVVETPEEDEVLQQITLDTNTSDEYGDYVVSLEGLALYAFTADEQNPSESACTDECAQAWPPLVGDSSPELTAPALNITEVGTFERANGMTQVTYNGWPLYYFAEDMLPGDTMGQGVEAFGGTWHLVSPEGELIDAEMMVEATATEEATATPEAEEASATPETGAMLMPAVTVEDQDLGMGDTVTVPSVTAAEAGWIVIHADEDGAPGPVIGQAAVDAGENMDVEVEIDADAATSTLYAMLHADTGEEGVYEFPDADAPVQDDAGNIVVQPFAVMGLPEAEAEADVAEANMVDVELVEYDILMPEELPAGPTEFSVTNGGTLAHNFRIEGEGISEVFDTNLAPSETRTMQVDLEPGTYEVWCPVPGHRGLGMELELTVTGEDM